jgi:hypothetical protein
MIACDGKSGSCLVFALLFLSLSPLMGADATVVVRVVDDLGNVVPGARVIAGWNLPREPGNGSGVGRGVGISGTTDKEGMVSLSVQGVPGIEVSMDGYYQNGIDGMDVMPKYFRNPVFSLNVVKLDVAISRIIRPVPMYVRLVRTKIPSLDGKDCGFDLELGDWVTPNGKGTTSDFVIRVIHKENEPRDWDQEGVIGFSSPNDGIIKVAVQKNGSRNKLRLPAAAPLNGYDSNLKWSFFSHRGESRLRTLRADPDFLPGTVRLDSSSWSENDNYVFRIRSKTDEADGSIRAIYGKIHGPISVTKNGLELQFLYYLNPSGEPGLEWDMENNLAKVSGVPLQP